VMKHDNTLELYTDLKNLLKIDRELIEELIQSSLSIKFERIGPSYTPDGLFLADRKREISIFPHCHFNLFKHC
jgi:hypothetical protein